MLKISAFPPIFIAFGFGSPYNKIILMYKYIYLLTIQVTLFEIISFGKNA